MMLVHLLAAFVTLTVHLNPAPDERKERVEFSYCDLAEPIPPIDVNPDFREYSASLQTSNCDYLWKQIRGNVRLPTVEM